MEGNVSNNPLLTIGIPTYNGSRTIRNMLDILLPQVDFNTVEILISDNCSTDETPEIINEYKKKFPQINVITNESNLGADGNFLQCMLTAKGKFVMLISDDDIIVENAVARIIAFLTKHEDVSLVYLDAVAFRDIYKELRLCHRYKEFMKPVKTDICTTDKALFLEYSQRLWGFTSVYIWRTERIRQIEDVKKYFNSYFLQAYINIHCTNFSWDKLGLIAGPCIAVGEYGIIGNYDVALVEGVNYHKMIDFAVEYGGYDRKRFEKWYIWKLCRLCRNAIIKERAIKVKKTSVKNILAASYRYPKAWYSLYPFLLLPKPVCRYVLKVKRKAQGRAFTTYVNRPT